MLTSALKILDVTKSELFKLNFNQNDKNVGQKCFPLDFSNCRRIIGTRNRTFYVFRQSRLPESIISEILNDQFLSLTDDGFT